MKTETCFVTQKKLPLSKLTKGSLIRSQIKDLIVKDYPDFTEDSYISNDKLKDYRKAYLEQIIRQEYGEVDELEKQVVDAIHSNQILSDNIEPDLDENLSIGQKIADNIAEVGGSWSFIIFFFVFLALWMCINVWVLATKPFDPYPFILLNLMLSCLAAIQAPIIMMSQNRVEQKDRKRSEHDYMINLKAELEIRLLHEKIDHLMVNQSKRLMEIQELQMDYLEEIAKKKTKARK